MLRKFLPSAQFIGALLLASLIAASAGADDSSPTPEPAAGKPRLVVQLGPQKIITSAVFSPDGKQVLAGSYDGTARLWDAASGLELRKFEGNAAAVMAVAFSPDGKLLLTADLRSAARLWDAASGTELLDAATRTMGANCAAFSPDGKHFLIGGLAQAQLWDTSGNYLRMSRQYSGQFVSAAFSPDGKQLLVGGNRKAARLLDAASGKTIHVFKGHADDLVVAAFSHDGTQVLTGASSFMHVHDTDNIARLWDSASGNEIREFKSDSKGIASVAFSPNGKQVLTGGRDRTIRLWDVASGEKIREFKGYAFGVSSVGFSPDGKQVLTGGADSTVRLWDIASGREIREFKGYAGLIRDIAVSPEGKRLLTGGDNVATLWDAAGGRVIRRFKGDQWDILSVAFSPDGKQALTGSAEGAVRLWDLSNGRELQLFKGHTWGVTSVAFTRDGKKVLTGSLDRTARLWDAASGKQIYKFSGSKWLSSAAVLSPDGKQILAGLSDHTIHLWDAASGKEIRNFAGFAESLAFSLDGKQILIGGRTMRLLDAATGQEIRNFASESRNTEAVAFSRDGKFLLSGDANGTAQVWDAATGTQISKTQVHGGRIHCVVFLPDSKRFLSCDNEGTICLWDTATGDELCTLVSFKNGNWAIIDPQGRFDSSNAGNIDGLHWVVGNEPIDLAQLKQRYYEPGLFAKKLGFNLEPLRDVQNFDNPRLAPTVAVSAPLPNRPTLDIGLANRGGGIGRVVVRINGKELTADARGSAHDPNDANVRLSIALPPDQPLLIPGKPNKIEVEAYNAEGYLRSRGLEIDYEPSTAAASEPPQVWIVVAGISDYRGKGLHLTFAAKDAEDFAKAIGIGARRLFGPERVHLNLLTSSQADPRHRPTRANLLAAFQEIRNGNAKSTDILILYLAGHGVTQGGQDGDFYFLTSDAESGDLKDPAVRESTALSSQEIAGLINGVPALKQVLLLDTCASGRLIQKLVEKRDVPTSQLRALDRLKDRTGMFVLAGCAADAVSYETSRYGQGVLTYSLLLGMRGSALRDEQFVDVGTLFGFSADKVPELARDIGGIQRPVVAVPNGGSSFDIGQLMADDRQKIPLQAARPLMLRSTFQDEDSFDDVLDLSKRVDELLRNSDVRGSAAGVVFVDARELPDGYRLAGRYKTAGGKTMVAAKLFHGQQKAIAFSITGTTAKPDELAQQIVAEAEKRVAVNERGR